jgi:RNA-directed DNA polymerase
MKRAADLLEKVADFDNLRLAFWKAATGKRHANQVQIFAKNLDKNLLALRAQLISGEIDVGNYRYFKIFEPKERQICASAFHEQVIHHALMNVCHDRFERFQVFDSYASRKGKGQFAALERAKICTAKNEWFLKLDIRKFFDSVPHDVLKAQLARLFKDSAILRLFYSIIDSYEASPARGLPIGNLTSQYFANHFLAELDHFLKEKMRVKNYVRYMDDLVVWSNDKNFLKNCLTEIQFFVENELHCQLKPPLLNRTSLGLPFLGYRVFPNTMKLTTQSKRRFFRKMQFIENAYFSGEWDEKTCQNHALPLLAFVQKADSQALLTHFFEKINEKGRPP